MSSLESMEQPTMRQPLRWRGEMRADQEKSDMPSQRMGKSNSATISMLSKMMNKANKKKKD
jgi:hypothetical protein